MEKQSDNKGFMHRMWDATIDKSRDQPWNPAGLALRGFDRAGRGSSTATEGILTGNSSKINQGLWDFGAGGLQAVTTAVGGPKLAARYGAKALPHLKRQTVSLGRKAKQQLNPRNIWEGTKQQFTPKGMLESAKHMYKPWKTPFWLYGPGSTPLFGAYAHTPEPGETWRQRFNPLNWSPSEYVYGMTPGFLPSMAAGLTTTGASNYAGTHDLQNPYTGKRFGTWDRILGTPYGEEPFLREAYDWTLAGAERPTAEALARNSFGQPLEGDQPLIQQFQRDQLTRGGLEMADSGVTPTVQDLTHAKGIGGGPVDFGANLEQEHGITQSNVAEATEQAKTEGFEIPNWLAVAGGAGFAALIYWLLSRRRSARQRREEEEAESQRRNPYYF